jgi:hypothetical protein
LGEAPAHAGWEVDDSQQRERTVFDNWIFWIVFVIIWIALAFWPARVAGRKGHSFFGYFVLSLFFFPLALIIAYMLRDRTKAAG